MCSADWLKRYVNAGIEVIDYRSVKGRILPPAGKITIVQVDSLARIHSDGVDVFILDEMQSIIT